MLYKAIVIDNSNFFRDGTVRVRVSGHYMGNILYNLADNYPDEIEAGELEENQINKAINYNLDFNAIILSSMGGGRNYGSFILPQINETGVVAFLGRNLKSPVWMGAVFEPKKDDSFNIEYANIPSDKMDAEGEDSDGLIDGEHNMDAEDTESALKKNIIIRTKNTYRGDDAESVDWQQRPTTNIISVGATGVKVQHFDEEDGWDGTIPQKWQTFQIKKNDEDKESISMAIKNDADDKESLFELTEEGMKVFVRDGSDENTFNISIGDNGINFVDQHGNEIVGTSDGITIKTAVAAIESDEIQLNGTGDTAVRFSKLLSIIEEFEKHVHITQGPAGPTSAAMKGPAGAPPIGTVITADKNQLESDTIKVK